MPQDPLKQKLLDLLRQEFPTRRDKILLRDGYGDFLHLYVVSTKFKGVGLREANERIWSILFRSLSKEEWGRVSLVLGIAPDEVNGWMPELRERAPR
jgi:hypothetical protein